MFVRISFVMRTLLPVLLLSVLPGCLDYTQEATIEEDGSGSMSIHYWMSESMLVWMKDGSLTFNEDSVRHRYSAEGIDVQSVEVYAREEDSTRHVAVGLQFEDINNLSACEAFKDVTFRWMREGDVFRFEQTIPVNSTSDEAFLERFTFTYTYTFPGEIRESNADSLSDGRAVWEFKLSELGTAEKLTAVINARSGVNVWWIVGVTGVVVVLIVVLTVARRKRGLTV
ncbi:MAG: hypothetical protein JXA28_09680 [Bacteroidetes bacterium]|nr:hypothetical protein [Bacteroidota bacterium]